MVDWESVLNAQDEDELKDAKLWLFRENMRLEKEWNDFNETKEHFIKDRVKFRDEMEELNRRMLQERKRLREENQFFDKKMAILQDGFRSLEEDRQKLKKEKLAWETEKRVRMEQEDELSLEDSNVAEILFRKAENPLTLRKRYKDLVKIFHPDNVAGDEQLVQLINREFNRRKAAL